MIRSAYHQLWRRLAQVLPIAAREDYLPGYAWLHTFCWGYVQVPSSSRADLVRAYIGEGGGTPVYRALVRAGGAARAFDLILDEHQEQIPWNNFRSPENPEPDLAHIAGSCQQLASILCHVSL